MQTFTRIEAEVAAFRKQKLEAEAAEAADAAGECPAGSGECEADVLVDEEDV